MHSRAHYTGLLNEIPGHVFTSQYLDVLAGAAAVSDGSSPAAVTTAAAGRPILALPPSEASGAGASNALSAPEAVASAGSETAPFDAALGGGGGGGEAGGGSGVCVGFGTKAGAAAAPAATAVPGTAWSGERASAVATVPAKRFSGGQSTVSEQVCNSSHRRSLPGNHLMRNVLVIRIDLRACSLPRLNSGISPAMCTRFVGSGT